MRSWLHVQLHAVVGVAGRGATGQGAYEGLGVGLGAKGGEGHSDSTCSCMHGGCVGTTGARSRVRAVWACLFG